MNKKAYLKIEKIIEKEYNDDDVVIFTTMEGLHIQGRGDEVLSLLCMLIRKLKESGLPEEMIKKCFDIGTKNEKELLKMLSESLENLFKGCDEDEPSDSDRETN